MSITKEMTSCPWGGLRVLVYREQIAMENTVIQDTLQNTLYDSL